MSQRGRSVRDELSEDFIISIADVFEAHGANVLREVIQGDPDAALDLLSRVLRPEDVEAVRVLGGDIGDDILQEIAERVVAGIRKGTAAEGKPPPNHLN